MQKNKVTELLIPSHLSTDYLGHKPFNSLADIKRLNVFIGSNNAGKSRFMRELFWSNSELLVVTNDPFSAEVRAVFEEASALLNAINPTSELIDLHQRLLTALAKPLVFQKLRKSFAIDEGELQEFHQLTRAAQTRIDYRHVLKLTTRIYEKLRSYQSAKIASKQVSQVPKGERSPLHNLDCVYIPTLRGMRLGDRSNNLSHAYFDRTWRDYAGLRNRQGIGNVSLEDARINHHGKEIQTGLNLYDWVTDRLLGTLSDRRFIREFEQYLSNSFFQGDSIALIPRRDAGHDTLNIKIGKEKEKPIQLLGDGLQQIIILTLPIFEHKDKPLVLFIEEPELFLHPGFQRAFINAVLESPNEQLYVFVTTHSNHFVDITLPDNECSIYLFQKNSADSRSDAAESSSDSDELDPTFTISNLVLGDFEILNQLGVKPSSIFFSNCTIWVEGITDRFYFKKYLQIIIEKEGGHLLENLHYSFVEYGGSNVIHWSFLDENGPNVERLCSKLMLIADSDIGKDERHKAFEKSLGKRFVRLPVMEVENLLTPGIIKQVIQAYEGDAVELNSFCEEDYRMEKIGAFIEERVMKEVSRSRRRSKNNHPYAEDSKTLKGKLDFCNKAISFIKSEYDMSADAISVAKKMYEFILQQNRSV
jgi:hypothetical protein